MKFLYALMRKICLRLWPSSEILKGISQRAKSPGGWGTKVGTEYQAKLFAHELSRRRYSVAFEAIGVGDNVVTSLAEVAF